MTAATAAVEPDVVPGTQEPTPTPATAPTGAAGPKPALEAVPRSDFATNNFLDDPPSVLVYGIPGSGKSTDIFKAFPNSFFLLSAKSVLRPAASWIRENPSCGLQMPLPLLDDDGRPNTIEFDKKRNVTIFKPADGKAVELEGIRRGAFISVPEFTEDAQSNQLRINNWSLLTTYAKSFIKRCQQDPGRYDAIVIDEMSAFSQRVFEDIKLDKRFVGKSGGRDSFKEQAELHVFHRWLGKYVPAMSKKAIVLACHSVEPKYFDDDQDPRHGKLKYMGGPKFPMGSLIDSVTADFDVVIQLKMVDTLEGVARVYLTEADPLYVRKFRDFSIKAKEKIGLRDLLARAAYRIG